MNTISRWTMGLALLAGAAYGQVPASNDTSDERANTGMGTAALHGPAALNTGISNTASGVHALLFNTSGSDPQDLVLPGG